MHFTLSCFLSGIPNNRVCCGGAANSAGIPAADPGFKDPAWRVCCQPEAAAATTCTCSTAGYFCWAWKGSSYDHTSWWEDTCSTKAEAQIDICVWKWIIYINQMLRDHTWVKGIHSILSLIFKKKTKNSYIVKSDSTALRKFSSCCLSFATKVCDLHCVGEYMYVVQPKKFQICSCCAWT